MSKENVYSTNLRELFPPTWLKQVTIRPTCMRQNTPMPVHFFYCSTPMRGYIIKLQHHILSSYLKDQQATSYHHFWKKAIHLTTRKNQLSADHTHQRLLTSMTVIKAALSAWRGKTQKQILCGGCFLVARDLSSFYVDCYS